MFSRPLSLALLALLLPSAALAADAVVPPLVAKGVDPLVNLNLTSLISSEADFLGVFENVNQLDSAPAGLSTGCLASTSCLYKIAKGAGAGAVLAGQATTAGDNYSFKLVYYDLSKNRIVRTVSFSLPNSPAEIADGMGGHVREVVTGSAPAEPESTALGGFDDVDLYEDDDFETVAPTSEGSSHRIQTPTGSGRSLNDDLSFLDDEPDDHSSGRAAERAAEDAARKRADEDAARREEEAAARRRADEESARKRAEEQATARREAEAADRRRAEEEIARRNAEATARREAEAAARRAEDAAAARAAAGRASATASSNSDDDDEDSDFENFTLSSSTTVVAAAEPPPSSNDDLDFLDDDNSRSRSSSSRSSSSRSSSSRSSYDDLDDLDSNSSRSRPSSNKSSRSKSSNSSSRSKPSSSSSSGSHQSLDRDSSDTAGVMLAGRVGFAPYQGLGFVTYGAEIGYLVSGGLALAGGIEAYSVQRTIPPENLDPGEAAKQWNTILPINLGLQYHIGQSSVRPYFGAELLIVPGIVRGSNNAALGGRGRAGANFFVAEQVAINLNAAVGFLSGKDMPTIADGMSEGGVAPQVSAGTVLFF